MENIKNYPDNKTDFYQQAFSRNIGLFTEKEQEKIGNSKVAIAGLGGVGGNYLMTLVRLGVGNFAIADPDFFEIANINRQAGASAVSAGKSKCEVMRNMAMDINPFLNLKTFSGGIDEKNIDEFLEGIDVALDGLDFFSIRERMMFFKKAREKNIFAITSPPIGFGASLLIFDPGGMSFEDYFDVNEDMDDEDLMIRFALGLSPSLMHRRYFNPEAIDFSAQKTPSLGVGTVMCSALVATETAKIILGKKIWPVPFSSQFDPFLQRYGKLVLRRGNRCLMQKIKLKYFKKVLAAGKSNPKNI